MVNRKIIMLAILLATLLTVSAVSANENVANDVVGANETTDEVYILGQNQEESDVGTFDELSSLIKNAAEGSSLELDKNYQNVNGSDKKILIDKSITINGNGHTLDGSKKSGIFKITSPNVVLNNINFINALSESRFVSEGGAISWYGNNGTLYNCSFRYCEVICSDYDVETEGGGYSYGGAVYWQGSYGNLHNCSFICTSASSFIEEGALNYLIEGGAVYWYGANGALSNCSFVYTGTDEGHGGSIYWHGANGALSNCSFVNTSATRDGGAVYWYGANGALSNCGFVNSRVSDGSGSSIYWRGTKGALSNCSFVNTSADYEGEFEDTVCWFGVDGTMFNCIFNGDHYNYENYCYAFYKLKPRLVVNAVDAEEGLNILVGTQELIHNLTAHIYNVDDESFDEQIVISSRDNLTQKFILNNLSYGKYIIALNYPGDDVYLKSSANTTFYNQDIMINVSSINVNYKDDSELVATLADTDGNPVAGVDVVLTLDDVNYPLITNSAGQIKFPTKNLTIGNHTAIISFNGKYNSSSARAKVTVNKLDAILTAKYDNATKNIVATVKDNNGNAISNIKVGFDIDGVKYNLTDANGQAKYSTSGLTNKKHIINVMAYGNEIYKDSNNETVIVDLTKISTTLTASDVTMVYNGGKDLVAILKDANGKVISDVKVTVKVANITKTLTTNKNGEISLSLNGIIPNTYTATITFEGNDLYEASSAAAKVTINKQQAKIYLRNALYFVLQTKMVQVTLWDGNNNPISGKTVYINLDEYGLKYSGVTDKDGNAYIRVGVGFGNHPATVSFEGDDAYNSDSKTGRVRVIKETPSLMLPGAYTKFKATDKTKTIKVYLKDRYNKPLLPKTKVFVTINGHQYVGLIDNEGIASININLNKAGVYNVDLYYTGNTAYNAVRKTTKITIV